MIKVEKEVLVSITGFSTKNWISKITESDNKYAMPVITYAGVSLTGKKILDIAKHGEEQYKCIKALSEKYPSIAAMTSMDLSVEAEAFGAVIDFKDDEVPSIRERLLKDSAMINELDIPEVGTARSSEYLAAAKMASQDINDRPVFGGMIGPYSLAGRLFDISELMVNILIDPESSHLLLSKVTAFLKEYAMMFKKQGADGLIIAEPAAGLLPENMCEEFSSAYIREIIEAVQDDSFMVILHNCGNTVDLVASMVLTGAMGLHFGNAVDMIDLLPNIPANRLVFGNIDPVSVIKNGTPERIKYAVNTLLNKASGYKNFVLSSGCDIPYGTPAENIDALFEALNEYNKKSNRETK
jgi:uroporphyrinogen decarboxylase